ncbi:MAG: hypothetical protein JOY77_13645 [Alphaproteobacteria bacterium]|nr:hypothetical protein [Alphaproteobacteria bacterium]
MNQNNWDWIDWLKVLGYGTLASGVLLSFLGDRRAAANLRGFSTMCGLVTGFADLVEPPKHCGRRASYDTASQSWVCTACGRPLPNEPRLFDWS